MTNAKINFLNILHDQISNQNKIKILVKTFMSNFEILEKNSTNVLTDNRTGAFYIECNIKANDIIGKGTIDVPLDPEEQPDYRANREVAENNTCYHKMIEDAKKKRVFSNIIAEYNVSFDTDKPLKIIEGQHRVLAREKARN